MPQRHFLGWESPLPQAVAAWLLEADGPRPHPTPDLGSFLVLVPTRQAADALLESLALRHEGDALLPPLILTPTLLLSLDPEARPVAPARQMKCAWIETLRRLPASTLEPLIPPGNTDPTPAWLHTLADELTGLQQALHPRLLTLEAVRQTLESDQARWKTLAALESIWEETLNHSGFQSPHQAWAALSPVLLDPRGIRRIIVAGIPDLLPAARAFLTRAEPAIPVLNLILAPADRAGHFDEWGEPDPDAWTRPLDLPDLDRHLHRVRSHGDLAHAAARLVGTPDQSARSAVAVNDDALRSTLTTELDASGMPYRRMAGITGQALPVTTWLETLIQWLRHPGQAQTLALTLHPWSTPAALEAAGRTTLEEFLNAWDRLLRSAFWRELDDLSGIRPRHRESLDFARALHAWLAPRHRNLLSPAGLEALRRELAAHPWPEGCPEADRDLLRDLLEFWLEPDRLPGLTLPDRLELCRGELESFRLFPDQDPRALPLHGWIDSLWIDRPHLLITVLHQNEVPPAPFRHLFLPRTAAARLGFPDERRLHARDAFVLQALIATRSAGGRVDFLVSRSDGDGNPLLPSPLLTIAPDDELAERIELLFSVPPPSSPPPPGPRAPLALPARRLPPDRKISVTALGRHLDSPFYFHLQTLQRWDTRNPDSFSLDPLDYGSLCHKALELYFRQTREKPESREDRIADGLAARLDDVIESWAGKNPHLGLQLQVESIRSRLRAFAAIEARARAAGWRTIEIEMPITIPLGDWTLSGVIDRIDQGPEGRLRILDYKTSDKANPPGSAHLKALRAGSTPLPEAVFEWNGKPHRWTNLQLPLYMHFARQAYPQAGHIECGYIQLPKALQDIRLELWEDFESALTDEALACARRILDQLESAPLPDPEPFRDQDRDLWHLLMGPAAFEAFDIHHPAPERARP